jgi:hypothetical protein
MNPWLQTKQYGCPRCQALYLHDKARTHALYSCPLRPRPIRPMPLGRSVRSLADVVAGLVEDTLSRGGCR